LDKSLLLNLVGIIAQISFLAITLLRWGLIIYILSSWLPALRESKFGEFLGRIFEPILEPFRKIIPPLGGMLDLSPIILFLVLWLFQRGLVAVFNALNTFIIQF